jgi:hypothetical protein
MFNLLFPPRDLEAQNPDDDFESQYTKYKF